MLESVFIMIVAMAFILFVLAIHLESFWFSATSLLMWILILAGAVRIDVPNDTYYNEFGIQAVAFGFIFLNVIYMIYWFMTETFEDRYHM